MRKNTSELTGEILRSKSLDSYEQKNATDMIDELSLSDYLDQLLTLHAVAKKDVINRSNVDSVYAYQIFQGKKKKPSRDILIRRALAFPLDVAETKRLLYYGGAETLYPRVRRDAHIMYAIHNRFSVIKTDIYLSEHGEKELA